MFFKSVSVWQKYIVLFFDSRCRLGYRDNHDCDRLSVDGCVPERGVETKPRVVSECGVRVRVSDTDRYSEQCCIARDAPLLHILLIM